VPAVHAVRRGVFAGTGVDDLCGLGYCVGGFSMQNLARDIPGITNHGMICQKLFAMREESGIRNFVGADFLNSPFLIPRWTVTLDTLGGSRQIKQTIAKLP